MRVKIAVRIAIVVTLALCGTSSWSAAQQGAGTISLRQPEGSQFFLLGFIEESGTRRGILGWQGLVFLVREGDTVLGTYRVERLGDDVVILREGEREIRAPFRPKQPDVVALPPSPQATMTAGTVSPSMVEQPPQTFAPPGPITSPGGTAVAGKGAITSPAPSIGGAGPSGSSAQPPDDNPFARALRERAQQTPPSTPADNPFVSGAQQGAPALPPGDNPFLRALRERGSSPTSTQDNPFLRALRERGY